MLDYFTRHPRSLGESYGTHLRQALRFGVVMTGAGAACIVHAFLPFLFERTASGCVARLHEELRRRSEAAGR